MQLVQLLCMVANVVSFYQVFNPSKIMHTYCFSITVQEMKWSSSVVEWCKSSCYSQFSNLFHLEGNKKKFKMWTWLEKSSKRVIIRCIAIYKQEQHVGVSFEHYLKEIGLDPLESFPLSFYKTSHGNFFSQFSSSNNNYYNTTTKNEIHIALFMRKLHLLISLLKYCVDIDCRHHSIQLSSHLSRS